MTWSLAARRQDDGKHPWRTWAVLAHFTTTPAQRAVRALCATGAGGPVASGPGPQQAGTLREFTMPHANHLIQKPATD